MITIIDEHSVDLDLLPEKAVILDAGCRGFGFTNYFRERGHKVLAIDIGEFEGDYRRMAIANKPGIAYIKHSDDPQALKISEIIEVSAAEFHTITLNNNQVYACSLRGFQNIMGIDQFDLIKLDIEGEEYEILKHASHPIAKQISVEFHAHCGQSREQLDWLLDYLSRWYTIHNRVWEERHCAGFNYWDLLLISKT